jgi:hypothetical protein
MDRSEDDVCHAILLDLNSDLLFLSPPLNLPVRSSPSSQRYRTNRTARPFRTAEVEREEVNRRIRERVPRPYH